MSVSVYILVLVFFIIVLLKGFLIGENLWEIYEYVYNNIENLLF